MFIITVHFLADVKPLLCYVEKNCIVDDHTILDHCVAFTAGGQESAQNLRTSSAEMRQRIDTKFDDLSEREICGSVSIDSFVLPPTNEFRNRPSGILYETLLFSAQWPAPPFDHNFNTSPIYQPTNTSKIDMMRLG
uniref:Uncharacterized protein n=1 Tax=Romanomermis culicivorax TaxID=13658 RepID=A0A915KI85_ROMCU